MGRIWVGNVRCLADKAGPRGFFLPSVLQTKPGAMGSAWERRMTFGPKPAENETFGADWE